MGWLGILRHGLLLMLLSDLPAWASSTVTLTDSQRDWLERHPQIVWAPEADYQPFIFLDAQQQPSGLSYSLLAELQKRLGLGLKSAPAAPLAELLDQARQRRIDVLTSLRPTPERTEYLAFTSAYVEVPSVLVGPATHTGTPELAQLSGRKVAVGQGYAIEQFVRQHYPQIHWQAMPTDRASLEAVLSGEVEAAAMDIGSASYLMAQLAPDSLKIGERIDFDYPLSLAYRKDWPILGEILEAGLRSLSLRDREALFSPWLTPLADAPRPLSSRYLLTGALLMVLLGAALLLVQRRYRPVESEEAA